MAVDLFLARPGSFGPGNFYLGVFCARIIYVPYFLVDGAKCPTGDALFDRTCSASQRCAYPKGVDSCSSLYKFANLPLVQVAAGQNAYIVQASPVKLFTDVVAISNKVTTIQSYSGKGMAQGFLGT